MLHLVSSVLIGPVMSLKIMRAITHLAFVSSSVFDRSGYCLPVIRLKIIAVLHKLKPGEATSLITYPLNQSTEGRLPWAFWKSHPSYPSATPFGAFRYRPLPLNSADERKPHLRLCSLPEPHRRICCRYLASVESCRLFSVRCSC